MTYQYSDDDLIRILRETAGDLGRTPTQNWMDENGEVTAATCSNRFGSWNEALEAAGLELNQRKDIGDEELLDMLRKAAHELGHTPGRDWFQANGEVGTTTIRNRFGSWNEALERAELTPRRERNIPDEVLLVNLKAVADQLGHSPSSDWYNENGRYSTRPFIDRFGSWNAALREAGLDINRAEWADEEIIDVLTNTAEELGHTPTYDWINDNGPFSTGLLEGRFETFNQALEAAGLDVNHRIGVSEMVPCAECGTQVSRTPSRLDRSNNHFCSTDCYHDWYSDNLHGPAHPLWDPDKKTIPWGSNWNKKRLLALQRDGYKCRICGMTRDEHQDEYGADVHVHHLSPRREFWDGTSFNSDKANRLSNLVTLCAVHHRFYEYLPVRPQVDME